MAGAGCAGGKGANRHGCWRAGMGVAAKQEEAAINPLTVFPCAAGPFMPANRSLLGCGGAFLSPSLGGFPFCNISSPAQLLCKQQLAGFRETVMVPPPLMKLKGCAQTFRSHNIMSFLVFSWKIIQSYPQIGNQLYLEMTQRAALASKHHTQQV